VKGMSLKEGDRLIYASQIDGEGEIAAAFTGGRFKRVIVAQIDALKRACKGVRIAALKEGEKVLFASYVTEPYGIILCGEDGMREISTEEIPIDVTASRGKNVRGVEGEIKELYANLTAAFPNEK